MKRLRRSPAAVSLGSIAAAVLFASACDAGFVADAPSGLCTEAGVQCPLEKGQLGVCEQTRCIGEPKPPCFACVSQH